MRYSVKYLSGEIHAGTVRHDQETDRQVFITHCDVTEQAIGAVAVWLIAHNLGPGPYPITSRGGTTYELTARIVTGDEVIGR